MTKFQLFVRYKDDEQGVWREWSVEEAHTAKAAMNTAYMKRPQGDLPAIVAMSSSPVRSWNPQQVRTENVIRLHFGETETP